MNSTSGISAGLADMPMEHTAVRAGTRAPEVLMLPARRDGRMGEEGTREKAAEAATQETRREARRSAMVQKHLRC